MPIRPENRHYYRTLQWQAEKAAALMRAGYQCQVCQVPKKFRRVNRWRDWWQHPDTLVWHDGAGTPQPSFTPPFSERRNNLRLTVGVAHLNGIAGDDRPENLKVLCDYHHLAHDKPQHKQTRCTRKDAARPLLLEAGARWNF